VCTVLCVWCYCTCAALQEYSTLFYAVLRSSVVDSNAARAIFRIPAAGIDTTLPHLSTLCIISPLALLLLLLLLLLIYRGTMTVGNLAELLDEKPAMVVKYLMTDLGVMAAISQTLDRDTACAVASGFGRIVVGSEDDLWDDGYDDDDEYDDDDDEDTALESGFAYDEDEEEDLVPRAPVVTIMGHVDHGKTSLLDTIRNTRVTAGEAGGITQHIGAYQVQHNGSPITFIDTPGHAAFSDMRSRGANITDIVILVVAADDGVMQQTADSISCAKIAGVPLVVAINKCDLETADPTRIKSDLTQYGVLTEDMGGDILVAEISAKEGSGIDALLSKIMLQSELAELKANPLREAQGVVVEARMEKGLGAVATTLVQRGTIKVGDAFVAGETYGKVRSLLSTTDGKTRLDANGAGPSMPVQVTGFTAGVPAAGDILMVVENEQTARDLAESRQRYVYCIVCVYCVHCIVYAFACAADAGRFARQNVKVAATPAPLRHDCRAAGIQIQRRVSRHVLEP
jgi:translation initiation factor IF-2